MTLTHNQIIPELSVTSFSKSLNFYTNILGFSVAYQREEEGFAFLVLDEVQIMIDELGKGRDWKTAELASPFGRGINFQIKLISIGNVLDKLKKAGVKLFLDVEEKWYRMDGNESGSRQFLVQDPDGYLLRFFEDLGTRPLQKQ